MSMCIYVYIYIADADALLEAATVPAEEHSVYTDISV